MKITFYSVGMSLFWFNLYMVLFIFLNKKNKFITYFGTTPLIIMVFLGMLRAILNIEFKNAIIVRSKKIYPMIIEILKTGVFNGITVSTILLFIWILGLLMALFKSLNCQKKLKKFINLVNKEEEKEDLKVLRSVLKNKNCNRKVAIYRTENINSPMVIGYFKFNIFLPEVYIPREKLNYVLIHEVNHIIGKDNLKKLFLEFIRIMLWWNPFINKFINSFHHGLEMECDINSTSNLCEKDKVKYLESILCLVKNSGKIKENRIITSVALFNNSSLELKERFEVVLNFKSKKNNFFKFIVNAILICSFFISYAFIIKPHYYPKEYGIYFKMGEEEIVSGEDDNIGFIFKERTTRDFKDIF